MKKFMFKRYFWGDVPTSKFQHFPLSTFSIIISGGEKEGYRGGESVSGNSPPGGVEDQDQ